MRRIRILFVAEGVTLAHVTRPLILARSLDTNLFEIHFACAPGWERILTNLSASFWSIKSISSHDFLAKLSKGRPIYSPATLHSYVKEDLQLLKNLDPDLVVGDFRLSLSVSAARHGVPYATITNAYWSEYCDLKHYPIPELPVTRIFGVSASDAIFQRIQPWVFAYHARPLNHVRRKYGMPPFVNLLQTYTDANHVLYADIPGLFPTTALPRHHCYLGPLSWAPNIDLPDWWPQLDTNKPLIYVSLGSSGTVAILPAVVEALASLPVSVVIATAQRWKPRIAPSNMWVVDFLPGDRVAKRASLIICNGGSPSVYQALQEGAPVIGIPSNMDQHLMMQAIVREGAGLLVRSEHATRDSLQKVTLELLKTDIYRENARKLQKEIAQHCATTKFAALATKWARDAAPEALGAPH
jgi:UDP:flavonoid glycosyltransferase YjiC (YdhE family)